MRVNPLYVALCGVAIICICLVVFQLSGGAMHDEFNSDIANKNSARDAPARHANGINPFLGIPHLVHHTWKRSVAPPAELVRWRSGCVKLNPEYEFRMYNDEDLLDFTRLHFGRYLPMFQHLHGVYMADMARVLVAYHYGGIYMDLDFYCRRPFRCLIKQVMQQITTVGSVATDILVVAREPLAHAVLFRNKPRVVIQDFYMVTPKHPFLLWLLEDRYQLYQQSIAPSSSGLNSTHASANTSSKHSQVNFPKGPFSYSIEKDIDRYDAHKAALHSSDTAHTHDTDVIIELGEDILHPLLDATNARLFSACAGHSDTHNAPTRIAGSGPVVNFPHPRVMESNISTIEVGTSIGNALPVQTKDGSKLLTLADMNMKTKVCRDVHKRRYFQPSRDTVMVHMWTHVYLGWSFVRGLFNAWTYFHVESTLPPTSSC